MHLLIKVNLPILCDYYSYNLLLVLFKLTLHKMNHRMTFQQRQAGIRLVEVDCVHLYRFWNYFSSRRTTEELGCCPKCFELVLSNGSPIRTTRDFISHGRERLHRADCAVQFQSFVSAMRHLCCVFGCFLLSGCWEELSRWVSVTMLLFM